MNRKLGALLAAGAVIFAAPAHAAPDTDPTDYFNDLTYFGITVAGNEDFLLRLADMSCAMHDAGFNSGEIADTIRDRYNIPNRDAYNIASGAWVSYCSSWPTAVP